MRERVLACGKPSAGDDGRFSFELRLGVQSKPLEARRIGVSESDCEGRTGSGEVRRGDSVGNGDVLGNRENPEGWSNPTSVDPGKLGQEWMAEQIVEVVETARAKHSGQAKAAAGSGLRIWEPTFGSGTEWTPPLDALKGG
jgi:hypothetical protein